MILIPEIETVVILVPRTGSGSLCRAIKARYPKAMMPYRHMEADGVPQGYDRWPKVGVVRDPVDRLWSLYKFLKTMHGDHDAAYLRDMHKSVSVSFEQWLLNNETVFTSPYDHAGEQRFFPHYCCRHPIPENRKSQFLYLRPDLGTEIFQYNQVEMLFRLLDLSPQHFNKTDDSLPMPALSDKAAEYLTRWFAWDFGQSLRKKSSAGVDCSLLVDQMG